MNRFLSLLIMTPMVAFAQTGGTTTQPAQPACPQLPMKIPCAGKPGTFNGPNGQYLGFNVTCDTTATSAVRVLVYNPVSGQILCDNKRFAGNNVGGNACERGLPRDPMKTFHYEYLVLDSEGSKVNTDDGGKINKDPTFKSPPQIQILSEKNVAPRHVGKALGRGYEWKFQVTAKVFDADVDATEGLNNIQVELWDITPGRGGKRIGWAQSVNTGGTATFTVEHEWVIPTFGGKQHPAKDLGEGQSVLKVKAFDAYSGGKGQEFWSSDPINVNIVYPSDIKR